MDKKPKIQQDKNELGLFAKLMSNAFLLKMSEKPSTGINLIKRTYEEHNKYRTMNIIISNEKS